MTPTRIVACLSGGVDSSVAAAKLVEDGHEVIGVFMRSGVSAKPGGEQQGCCTVEDALDARRVADSLGIPFYALNMEEAFGRLIDRFVGDYAEGRTPNPCVLCNRWLKFGHVLRFARQVDAEYVASGHYARRLQVGERWTLGRGADQRKDQSYVLAVLEQEQLSRLLLPLGEQQKGEIRDEATARGLSRVADKRDSQEICFVAGDYRDLLRERLPTDAPALQEGAIVDEQGHEIGRHSGTAGFTPGQRKGVRVALGRPAYVQRTDPGRRLVVVGGREGLLSSEAVVGELTFMAAALEVGETVVGRAQIRAHGRSWPAEVERIDRDRARVRFEEPLEAVVAGQVLVLYDPSDEHVLLSGWIR
ncbi:MAG: tRNA 2-thiouridine(34) synthase MnmA [Planctomycetes bacterium]|nr:tRNA 2-thiouridine(34) synthase MnmA [Planctomycetota bacterium]